jgi:hypothetical protein
MGGAIFNRGGVHHVLRNPLYIGEIAHKDMRHPGLHPPIIERAVFDAVAQRLEQGAAVHRASSSRVASSPLAGRIFDAEGEPMTPSFSYGKQGRRYRYYISKSLQQGRCPPKRDVIRRIGAPAVERFCVDLLSRISGIEIGAEELSSLMRRLEVRRDETHLLLAGDRLFPDRHPATMLDAARQRLEIGEVMVWHDEERIVLRLITPFRLQLRGGRTWIASARAAAPQRDVGLIEALRSSHAELRDLQASPLTRPHDLAHARAPVTMHRRQLARLPFLAPDLQAAVLQGRQPAQLKLRSLLKSELPLLWSDQRAWFDGI